MAGVISAIYLEASDLRLALKAQAALNAEGESDRHSNIAAEQRRLKAIAQRKDRVPISQVPEAWRDQYALGVDPHTVTATLRGALQGISAVAAARHSTD
jgi:hypothetical protein